MRLAACTLLLILIADPASSVDGPVTGMDRVRGVAEKIAQKIKMIDQILAHSDLSGRAAASADEVARELMNRAEVNLREGKAYFQREQYLEAEAVLDYVLRDLGASARLLSAPRKKSSEYENFIDQLDAFTLPEWSGLDETEIGQLGSSLERVSELRREAMSLAADEEYENAIALLEQAYRIKVALLDRFEHQTTVVYDLDFDTVQDEYTYLLNRTYHFLDLVQVVLSTREVDQQTRKLTDRYVYRSMVNLDMAESHEAQGRYSEAIPILGESISQLSAVLKILGVRI